MIYKNINTLKTPLRRKILKKGEKFTHSNAGVIINGYLYRGEYYILDCSVDGKQFPAKI